MSTDQTTGASDGDWGLGPGARTPDDPRQIGPYRLLDVLGEGGMGIIYLAEQTAPLRRRVALKLIKLGMDTRQVVARFDSERQALAVLDHPNIAKVYDGGATESGRPYFVMELVQGTPLTDYADTHKLTTEERIRLFIDVCHAIQHAHQKGVIHRDLKPSNVLVTVRESQPVVKVIDFGIAKAMGQGLTEHTLVTRSGQMIGTPEYMSPEQAEMSGLDVDTRTDIYSLGVILYELVVGALPFDLRATPDPSIPYALREQEVPRPSTKLTSLGATQEVIARQRRTTPEYLRRQLKGDLDWIILRAMEKDRTRRYETANALAQDLERYLADEPVTARPPSTRYRMGKFLRRNRAAAIAAAVAAVALLSGAGAATLGLVRAREAQARAEQEAATAQSVSDFLVRIFELADPDQARGGTITAREILDRGAQRIETELVEQPAVQARLLRTVGDVYRELGLYDEAERLLRRAVALHDAGEAAEPRELARALRQLGVLLRQRGSYAESERLLRRAIEVHSADPEAPRLERASLLSSLAGVYMERARYSEADSVYRIVLSVQEQEFGPEAMELATTLNNLGLISLMQRRLGDAQPLLERTLALRDRHLNANHPQIGESLLNLGALYFLQERYADAERVYTRARSVFSVALGPEHPHMARVLNNLAETYWAQRKWAEAERDFLLALALKERTLSPSHPSVATTLIGLANVYRDQGRYADAEPLYRRALTIRENSGAGPDLSLAEALDDFAAMLRAAGRAAEAAELGARAERIRAQRSG